MNTVNRPAEAAPELLLQACRKALRHAYAPYSKFPVAAAVLTEDGRVYSGCNIENASYGACCCAERVTLFKAVSVGERRFRSMAVWTPEAEGYARPCGICRQVMAEFLNPDTRIYLLDQAGREAEVMTVRELLPGAFVLEHES